MRHFGAVIFRGNRLLDEDTFQAGILDILPFAKQTLTNLACEDIQRHNVMSKYWKLS